MNMVIWGYTPHS